MDHQDNCDEINFVVGILGMILKDLKKRLAGLEIRRRMEIIGQVARVFANGPGDRSSIPGRVIPKTLKMVHDTSLLTLSNIRYVSGKVEQSRERSSAYPYTPVL